MLDMKFVRENPDIVKENIKKKFQDYKLPLVNEVLMEDKELRQTQQHADDLRANRKKISKEIAVQRKRLYNVDPLSSIEKEWGVTMTTPGMDMNKVRKKRPYNPLDLNN